MNVRELCEEKEYYVEGTDLRLSIHLHGRFISELTRENRTDAWRDHKGEVVNIFTLDRYLRKRIGH